MLGTLDPIKDRVAAWENLIFAACCFDHFPMPRAEFSRSLLYAFDPLAQIKRIKSAADELVLLGLEVSY
jgi:hypothetical protein